MTESNEIFNTKLALMRVAGKPEMAKQIFNMMLETLESDAKAVSEAQEKNDLAKLRELIHRLHGGFCYTGLPALEAIASKLDNDLVKGNSATLEEDLVEFQARVKEVLANVDTILLEFETAIH